MAPPQTSLFGLASIAMPRCEVPCRVSKELLWRLHFPGDPGLPMIWRPGLFPGFTPLSVVTCSMLLPLLGIASASVAGLASWPCAGGSRAERLLASSPHPGPHRAMVQCTQPVGARRPPDFQGRSQWVPCAGCLPLPLPLAVAVAPQSLACDPQLLERLPGHLVLRHSTVLAIDGLVTSLYIGLVRDQGAWPPDVRSLRVLAMLWAYPPCTL